VAREAFDGRAIKALLVAAAFVVLNPVLSQATARAQRVREHGDWRPAPEERQ
jgi:multisubunit Na+/H+ antiporter MnhG subunit